MKKINNISEFQKLFKINIPYEAQVDYYVETLCKSEVFMFRLPDLMENFSKYESDIEASEFESIKKYKLNYAMPKLINYIKNSKAYASLMEWELPDDVELFRKDGYKIDENDGSYFLSIDFSSANFSTFKLFDTKAHNEMKDTWQDLCESLDIHPVLARSKSFRQYVFGNVNPKRIGKVQHYNIMKLKKVLDEQYDDLDFMFISHDELIIRLKNNDTMTSAVAQEVNGICDFIQDKSYYPIHTEVFALDKLAKSIYLKKHFWVMSSNPGARGGFVNLQNWFLNSSYRSIHGAPSNLYYQYFKKHVLEEEVEERDLYFQDNGRLCKWVIRKEDDHKKVDSCVEVEGVNFYRIPKQLRKALPGITDEDISKIIAIYQDTCIYCDEEDAGCKCMNDD